MKRKMVTIILGLLTITCIGAVNVSAAEEENSGIQKVYTINHTFGDGQKVTNVILEYASEIDSESISADAYEVEGRVIVDVHTNCEAAETTENVEGKFVVLDLEVQSPIMNDKYATDGRIDQQIVIDTASVVQKEDIKSADGNIISGSDEVYQTSKGSGIMGNASIITPDISRFEDNHYYNDDETHAILHYNFYKPEGYEESGEKYPMVLFIPDASAVGKDWETVLQCGNGGTIWASDEWQENHPCFVITMIYEDKYINDYNEYYESWLTSTMNLIRETAETYPIDTNRIYTTGTSMGAMASMLMMEEDPSLFAAAYMVAGQWRDTEAVKDIKDQNILFLMSEDDPSYSRAEANVNTWEEEGGIVARSEISAVAPTEELESEIGNMFSKDANICFLSIQEGQGSIDAEGNAMKGGHRETFRIAYDLPGVKEWLFSKTK